MAFVAAGIPPAACCPRGSAGPPRDDAPLSRPYINDRASTSQLTRTPLPGVAWGRFGRNSGRPSSLSEVRRHRAAPHVGPRELLVLTCECQGPGISIAASSGKPIARPALRA